MWGGRGGGGGVVSTILVCPKGGRDTEEHNSRVVGRERVREMNYIFFWNSALSTIWGESEMDTEQQQQPERERERDYGQEIN